MLTETISQMLLLSPVHVPLKQCVLVTVPAILEIPAAAGKMARVMGAKPRNRWLFCAAFPCATAPSWILDGFSGISGIQGPTSHRFKVVSGNWVEGFWGTLYQRRLRAGTGVDVPRWRRILASRSQIQWIPSRRCFIFGNVNSKKNGSHH